MTLNFTVTQNDALAFTEKYLHDSRSHQRLRTRVQWGLPIILIAMSCFYTWRDGFSWFIPSIFGGIALAWWLLYPRRFDARIRAHAKKQMNESSYAKSLGRYEVVLLDEHLRSISPTGSSTYVWSGVDRVEMDSEYLYIFLSGPLGYPIRLSEIGRDTARSAYDLSPSVSHAVVLRNSLFQMTSTPNHAMQRTAGRSAFAFSMTSTFNRQRRALSPAVADLVSR